ncbi:MAG: SDR family oxidoreductase [Pirellulales bacterium]|nr:SDR family oxidoreductase [Pirellulales bacterium]
MRFENRTVVITGAGSGIGRAAAVRFAAEGARVVVSDLRAETARATADLVEQQGSSALVATCDVGDVASVQTMFQAIDDRGWEIDCLVNNAGNAEEGLQGVHEVSDERWRSMIRVHLDGTFYCTREAVRRMLPRQRGAIVNLGSVAGLRGLGGTAAYSAAKGGVIAFTKAISEEVAKHGIRANCVAPGWIETPMLDNLPERWRPGMVKHTPLGRIGRADEVAALVLFLASDDASFITGQCVSPNGGMYR